VWKIFSSALLESGRKHSAADDVRSEVKIAASHKARRRGRRPVRLPRSRKRDDAASDVSASSHAGGMFVCLHSKKDPGRGTVRARAGLSTALIGVNSLLERRGPIVRAKAVKLRMLRAATLSLFCLLCAAAPAHAQDGPSSFLAWLKHVTHAGTHHRHASFPPLPKARPAEAGPAVVAADKREAVPPNKMSEAIPD
jgi:hypothetical protein